MKDNDLTLEKCAMASDLIVRIFKWIQMWLKRKTYKGNFVNDQMNGYGHLEDAIEKSSYTGTFLNDHKFGQGTLND